MVEPLAGVFGAFAVVLAEPLLPYALAFAAGAMVYVVMDDIIPEAQIRLKSIPSPIRARLFPKPGPGIQILPFLTCCSFLCSHPFLPLPEIVPTPFSTVFSETRERSKGQVGGDGPGDTR